MNKLKLIVAKPFQLRNKKVLTSSELIFTLSLDLKWLSPEKVKHVLKEAERVGLVKKANDKLTANFDVSSVQIPLDFKPEMEFSIYEKIVNRITTEISADEANRRLNKMGEQYGQILNRDVIALLVAKELDIEISDLIREAYESLVE